MQLGMLRHTALHKYRGGIGIDTGREPVHHRVVSVLLDVFRLFVLGGQGVIIRDEKETFVFVLQLNPVFQYAMQVAEV